MVYKNIIALKFIFEIKNGHSSHILGDFSSESG